MALTFTRWVMLAVVGCALAATIVLHVESRPLQVEDARLHDLSRREDLAGEHLGTAVRRLRVLALRDSVLSSLERSSAHGRVLVDAAMPPELKQSVAELSAGADRERGVPLRYPGVIAFLYDTVTIVHGQLVGYAYGSGFIAVDHVLPTAPGAPCVTLVRLKDARQRGDAKTSLVRDVTVVRLLGPCAFYEAFGPPGAGIARWLADGGWALAQAGSWQRDVGRWEPFDIGVSMMLVGEDARSLELRGVLAPTGMQCIAGDAGACRGALATAGQPPRSALWGSLVSPRISERLYNGYSYGFVPRPLGPHEITYLGDLVHAMGAEKFARFWGSPNEPADAYRSATGADLDAWTMQWMRRAYGEQHRGPGAPTISLLVATFLAAIAGVAATYAMTKRQVAA